MATRDKSETFHFIHQSHEIFNLLMTQNYYDHSCSHFVHLGIFRKFME